MSQDSLANDLTPQEIMRREAQEPPRRPSHLPTGTQTVGPFFHYGLVDRGDVMLIRGGSLPPGERIHVFGTVYDGAGQPVNDALIEIWQADGEGRFHTERAETDFDGFGRFATGEKGEFRFETLKPGRIDDGESHAPHLDLHFFSRGMLHTLFTRLYFDDERNEGDALLQQVPEARRSTLVAKKRGESEYRFDIHLQGADETVFFEHA